MLTVWTRSKNICWEEQIIAVFTSANMEYFWYGKDIYSKKQEMLKEVCSQLNITHWIEQSTFPSWDELYQRFWSYSSQE
jgi:hypothetical protein